MFSFLYFMIFMTTAFMVVDAIYQWWFDKSQSFGQSMTLMILAIMCILSFAEYTGVMP